LASLGALRVCFLLRGRPVSEGLFRCGESGMWWKLLGRGWIIVIDSSFSHRTGPRTRMIASRRRSRRHSELDDDELSNDSRPSRSSEVRSRDSRLTSRHEQVNANDDKL
jgi:hypothetical protein